MERVKHEGHEHETFWAALRCTKATRARNAAQAHLVNKIRKIQADPDYRPPVLPADPFQGFRS